MGSISSSVAVSASPQQAYTWWRGLVRLPEIFPDVRSVEPVNGDPRLTHWKVTGPLGSSVQWDARIVEDQPARRIAWASVASEAGLTRIWNTGAVEFRAVGLEAVGAGAAGVGGARCAITVTVEYELTGGVLGEAIARRLSDPQMMLDRALESFAEHIEGRSTVPYPEETQTRTRSWAAR